MRHTDPHPNEVAAFGCDIVVEQRNALASTPLLLPSVPTGEVTPLSMVEKRNVTTA